MSLFDLWDGRDKLGTGVRYVTCSGCPEGWCKGEDGDGPWECCPDPDLMTRAGE